MDEIVDNNQEATLHQEALEGQVQPAPAGEDPTPTPGMEAAASPSVPAGPRVGEVTSLLDAAAAALAAGRWSKARRALVVGLEDGAALPEALRERLGETCLGVAAAAEAAGHWKAAADLLRQLLALGLATETVTARLEVMSRREEGQARLAQAQAAFVAGRWQECLDAADAAVAGLPTSMVARELRLAAAAEFEKEERRRRRAALYHTLPATLLQLGTRSASLAGQGVIRALKLAGYVATRSASLAGQGVKLASKLARDLRPSRLPATRAEARAGERLVAQPSDAPSARAEPARRRIAGELPPGWELAEEPGEAASRGDADLDATFGLSGAADATVARARHYIAQNPAVDEAYCWLARHYLLRGQFAEGRETLAQGLANCSRRRRLCRTYGWLELEAGRLNEAADWWLRSAQLQLTARRLDTPEPFLYLAYLAMLYGLTERADQLFTLADSIQHLRISESGKEELRTLATKTDKQPIVEAIGALGCRLDEGQ